MEISFTDLPMLALSRPASYPGKPYLSLRGSRRVAALGRQLARAAIVSPPRNGERGAHR